MNKNIILNYVRSLTIICLCALSSYATAAKTERIELLKNDRVHVWETIIYPGKKQELVMHRHDTDRVLIALTDGELKITNNKGETHNLVLKKDKAYFLPKDVGDETHTDENITNHSIKCTIVSLE